MRKIGSGIEGRGKSKWIGARLRNGEEWEINAGVKRGREGERERGREGEGGEGERERSKKIEYMGKEKSILSVLGMIGWERYDGKDTLGKRMRLRGRRENR